MNIKRILIVTLYMVVAVLLVTLNGCIRGEVPNTTRPRFYNGIATDITYTQATLFGVIIDKASSIQECGFIYSDSQEALDYEVNIQKEVIPLPPTGIMSIILTDLKAGQNYYWRLYAQSGESIMYGKTDTFKTVSPKAPLLDIKYIDSDSSSITLQCCITDNGGSMISDMGVEFMEENKSQNYYLYRVRAENFDENSVNTFSVKIVGLTPATPYEIKGYAINNIGVGYSNTTFYETDSVSTQ